MLTLAVTDEWTGSVCLGVRLNCASYIIVYLFFNASRAPERYIHKISPYIKVAVTHLILWWLGMCRYLS